MITRSILSVPELDVEQQQRVEDLLQVGGSKQGGGEVGSKLDVAPLRHGERMDLKSNLNGKIEGGGSEEDNGEKQLVDPSMRILSGGEDLGGCLCLRSSASLDPTLH